MTWLTTFSIAERVIPLFLFALYLITTVRLRRYSNWRKDGAPNPFLPRRIKIMLRKREIAQMARGQFPTLA
ncbi:MAG: hypothetical protein HKN27_13295 [Silicimonas sp.]|nr:hypothetical protein [Silicimonas sp.]